MINSQRSKVLEEGKLFEVDGFTAQLCLTEESKKIAFALRYEAYRNADVIPENEEKLFSDDYDLLPNTRTHLIWHEGEAIASVRSAIWSANYDWSEVESIRYFPKEIDRFIGLEKNVLESSRFVVSPKVKGRASLNAQLLLFRVQDLSSQFDQCDYILTAVREKHAKFYKRMLAFEQIAGPLSHEFIDLNIVLLMTTQLESRNVVVSKGMPACTAAEVENYTQLLNDLKSV